MQTTPGISLVITTILEGATPFPFLRRVLLSASSLGWFLVDQLGFCGRWCLGCDCAWLGSELSHHLVVPFCRWLTLCRADAPFGWQGAQPAAGAPTQEVRADQRGPPPHLWRLAGDQSCTMLWGCCAFRFEAASSLGQKSPLLTLFGAKKRGLAVLHSCFRR